MTLPIALKQLRAELGMKQNELAMLLNLNVTTVNRWETGKRVPNRSIGMLILNVAKTKGASTMCMESLKEALFPENEIEDKINDLRNTEIEHINQLVNESLNAVVVFCLDDFEVLYVNKRASEMTDISLENAKGMKCYQFLMHRETPCHNCNKEAVQTGEFEYTSQVTGCHYMIRSRKTVWDGKNVLIRYITEMTENYKMRLEAEQNKKILDYAASFADMMVFRYDIAKHRASLVSKGKYAENFVPVIEKYPNAFLMQDTVLPEYREQYLQMLREIETGKKQSGTEIRVRLKKDEIHWLRYQMNLIEYDENGRPKTAIGTVRDIDKIKSIENRVLFEHKRIVEENKGLLTYAVTNLTKNVIESSRLVRKKILPDAGKSFEETIKGCCNYILKQTDSEQFLKLHNRRTLLHNFAEGIQNYTIEYQLKAQNGNTIWARNVLNLYQEPVSQDIYLYEYCYDIHKIKIFEGVLFAANLYSHDIFGIISFADGQMTTVSYSEAIKDNVMKTVPYEEAISTFCSNCIIDEEQENFLKKTSLSELLELLKYKKLVSMIYHAKMPDGSVHRKLGRIFWFDEKNEIGLISSLDIEETE